MSGTRQQVIKITLAGAPGSGKTALVSKFALNEPFRDYQSTMNVDFYLKTIENQKLQLWDIGGNVGNQDGDLTAFYYHQTFIKILVLDGSGDFETQRDYLLKHKALIPPTPGNPQDFILLVTKKDKSPQISDDKIKSLKNELGASLQIHCSVIGEQGLEDFQKELLGYINKKISQQQNPRRVFDDPRQPLLPQPTVDVKDCPISASFERAKTLIQNEDKDQDRDALVTAIDELKTKTLNEFNCCNLNPSVAMAAAASTETLAKALVDHRKTDPARARQAIQTYRTETSTVSAICRGIGIFFGAVIGAAIGFGLGLLIGAGAGPAAAATALAGAAKGAIAGASIGGCIGLAAGVALTMWATKSKKEVVQVADKAERFVSSSPLVLVP